MIKIKICGITNLEDALYAVRQGTDALGFIFYKNSPRYIRPQEAAAIIKRLPASVKKVGVFVDARERSIRRIARDCRLDMLQFHGSESVSFCSRFKDFKIIKAFKVKQGICLADIYKYDVWAYMFDTFVKGKLGGTGKVFDWKLLDCLRGSGKVIFLSGGLKPGNISKALKNSSIGWVDASSALETRPGKKDPAKVKAFINKVRSRGV